MLDIKILLTKFAQEKSFSVESGGGGPQSNLNTLPYLAHMALYVINTTRAASSDLTTPRTYLSAPPSPRVAQPTAAAVQSVPRARQSRARGAPRAAAATRRRATWPRCRPPRPPDGQAR